MPFGAIARRCFLGLTAALLVSADLVSAADPITIDLIMKTETNPFFVKMKQSAEDAATEGGVKLVSASGKFDGDNASQAAAVQSMMTSGVKTILNTPNDSKAIVPMLKKARAAGILVIALDIPTEPQNATDALFATDNFKAGVLIGEYARASLGNKLAKIATLDFAPGESVGVLRHNGFLNGLGVKEGDPSVVCSEDTRGNRSKGQTAMENCLQRVSDINLVYTINERSAAGAYQALKAAGMDKNIIIASIDGGCEGVRNVQAGNFAATSKQYPRLMAQQGVQTGIAYAKTGKKATRYHDTGVTLITDKPCLASRRRTRSSDSTTVGATR
jgi:fructose transport system substrate-binding protein